MKKVVISAVGLAVLAGAYVAYPYYSVGRLGAAVSTGNPEKLQVMVDWPSVRNGLQADLNALLIGAVSQTAGDSPGRALSQIVLEVLGPKVVESAVDTYATPTGLAELIRSGGAIDMKAAASRTIATMNAKASRVDLSGSEPVPPVAMDVQPDMSTGAESVDAGAPETDVASDAQTDLPIDPMPVSTDPGFSITVKAVRFVGVNAMEIAFDSPDHPEKAPVKGIMKLSGATWKITRIILPVDEMLDAPQTAEMPPQ
jgi:hypothetical protein